MFLSERTHTIVNSSVSLSLSLCFSLIIHSTPPHPTTPTPQPSSTTLTTHPHTHRFVSRPRPRFVYAGQVSQREANGGQGSQACFIASDMKAKPAMIHLSAGGAAPAAGHNRSVVDFKVAFLNLRASEFVRTQHGEIWRS